jgi:arginine decarboxylase
VHRLTAPSAPLPDFSGFHPSFTDGQGVPTSDGDVRRAFYLSYNDSYCEYLMPDEVEQRVENGDQVVSTTYVTPYPPGFPVLVPGQVFSRQILAFMRSLDTPEVHGYRPELGYRVYVDKALEIAATARPAPPPNPASSLGSVGLADPVEHAGSPRPAAPASGPARPAKARRTSAG